jgi:hypothetical protein
MMEVSNLCLRKNTQEKQENSSMKVKKYLDPPYDSFGNGPLTSVGINSNTSVDLDSTDVGTFCLDFDRAQELQV